MKNMRNNTIVSVIVCCYRGEKTIVDCLDSLCNQSYSKEKYEIILIDDGSVDNTTNIINNYLSLNGGNSLIRYYRKENQGLSIARNFGISKANGSIISFVDEDALVNERFVEEVSSIFTKHGKINCVGGTVNLWNTDSNFAKLYHYSIFNFQMNDLNAIIGTNMSFRKEFLEEIGGFQKEFDKRGDETALFVKAGRKLNSLISSNIIVSHTQPSKINQFLCTRYENGYYKALIDFLKQKYGESKSRLHLYLLSRILLLFIPIITLIMINISIYTIFLLCLIYLLLLIKRFVLNQELIGPLRNLYKTSINFRIIDYFIVSYVIIIGFIKEDIGYIKGYWHYYNYNWDKLI